MNENWEKQIFNYTSAKGGSPCHRINLKAPNTSRQENRSDIEYVPIIPSITAANLTLVIFRPKSHWDLRFIWWKCQKILLKSRLKHE